jgi:hypothetical protein
VKSDFLDANERHWDDAERLFQAQRWANADHLYGMAAECGLKRLMQAFGMNIHAATGSPTETQDKVHANKIWSRFESYRSGALAGRNYVLSGNDPFVNWDVADRYGHQSNFGHKVVQTRQVGAKTVRDLIKKAQREGMV